MICFEIFVNGKRICLAGVAPGVLGAHLTSSQGSSEEGSADERESHTHLFVSGASKGERLRWPELEQISLSVGDEVTFKIVESTTPDEAIYYSPQKER